MSTLGTPINRLTHSVCDNHMNGMWEDVLTSGSDNLCFSKVNAYRSLDNLDLFISRIKDFYYLRNVGAHSAWRRMSRQADSAIYKGLAVVFPPRMQIETRVTDPGCTKDSKSIA